MLCPVCGSDMVLREGSKATFYGCPNYFKNNCLGKRDLEGNAWGCNEYEPYYINEEGSSMFQACLSDGFSYDEAAECAADWQRQEENDRWE